MKIKSALTLLLASMLSFSVIANDNTETEQIEPNQKVEVIKDESNETSIIIVTTEQESVTYYTNSIDPNDTEAINKFKESLDSDSPKFEAFILWMVLDQDNIIDKTLKILAMIAALLLIMLTLVAIFCLFPFFILLAIIAPFSLPIAMWGMAALVLWWVISFFLGDDDDETLSDYYFEEDEDNTPY